MKEFLKKYVVNNLIAKLMALAMAVALWMYAFTFSYSNEYSTAVHVNVITPEGWSVVGSPTVEVVMTFPRRIEEKVDPAVRARDIEVECEAPVDPNGKDEQEVTVALKESHLRAPPYFALRVVRFKPAELSLKLIRETSKNVRVLPKLSDPPPGYQIAYVQPIPTGIQITGRKDIVSQLSVTGLETDTIDISTPPPPNMSEWLTTQPARIPHEIAMEGASYAIRSSETVQVRLLLKRSTVEKVFTGVPIRLLIPGWPAAYPYDAVITERARAIDVTVRGPAGIVNAIKPEDIILYLEVVGLKPSGTAYTQPIKAHVTGLPSANDLALTLSTVDCGVKISERSAP